MADPEHEGTPRQILGSLLKPLLRPDWEIIDTERLPDQINGVTISLLQKTISKHPQAPAGHFLIEFVVQLTSKYEDMGRAEDELDDGMVELAGAMERLPNLLWTEATKALTTPQRLGYDINVQLVASSQKEQD